MQTAPAPVLEEAVVTPATENPPKPSSYFFTLLLLITGFAVIQGLIGGAKLVYSLPAYVIFGLAGICTFGAAWRKSVWGRPKGLCILSAVALGSYVIVRALSSPVAYLARNDLFMVLGALVVYFVTAVHLTGSGRRTILVWALLIMAAVHMIPGLLQFQDGNYMLLPWMVRPDYGTRASGFYICPNHLAGLLEMLGMVASAICTWGRVRPGVRIFAGYCALSCFAGVAISGSRGGYVSTLAGLLVLTAISGWLVQWIRRRNFPIFLAVAMASLSIVVGGGLYFMLKSPWLAERVNTIYQPTNMRIYLWQAALQQFELNPAVGTGSGTYEFWGRHFRSALVQNDPVHVHEDYLELLAEYGVAGTVLMAIFLGVHLHAGFQGIRRVVRARLKPSGRRCSNELALLVGIIAALFALMVHSLLDFNLHIPANTLLVAFFFGILANPTEALAREDAEPSSAPAWLRYAPVPLGIALAVAAAPLIPGEYFGERARMTLRDLQFPEAVAFAQQALKFEKHDPDTYFYVGEAKGLLGLGAKTPAERNALFESAVAAYREGLKLFPQDLRLRLRLGWTLDLMKRFDEADVPLRAAVEDDPNFGNVYAYYGFHMEHQQRWKKAEAFYRKAQDLLETEISTAGLKELEHDRKAATEDNVLPFVLPSDDDFDDDTPTPPPLEKR